MSAWPTAAMASCVAAVAVLIIAEAVHSEEFHFRTAYERVPGAEKVEAGDLRAGIEMLESQLSGSTADMKGKILATLCAAYTIDSSLYKARSACNEAVAVSGTDLAYNNRGVYRVFSGDWVGAREDFERVRPQQLDAYLEELKDKDPGLIALGNFQLINSLWDKHKPTDIDYRVQTPADIEQIDERR